MIFFFSEFVIRFHCHLIIFFTSLCLMVFLVAVLKGLPLGEIEKRDTDFRSILLRPWGSEIPFFNRKISNDLFLPELH